MSQAYALAGVTAAARVAAVPARVTGVAAARILVAARLQEAAAVVVALRPAAAILDAAPTTRLVLACRCVANAATRAAVPAVIGQAAVIINSLTVATAVSVARARPSDRAGHCNASDDQNGRPCPLNNSIPHDSPSPQKAATLPYAQ